MFLDNILIESDDRYGIRCVICDFGLARAVGNSIVVAGLTMPNAEGLTIRYSPPEVFKRMALKSLLKYQLSDRDQSIDVYAFAVSMYEVVTRKGFMKGLTGNDLMRQVNSGKRMEFYQDPAIPGLNTAINEGWKQNPSERPSMHDIFNMINNDVLKLESGAHSCQGLT